MKPTLIYLKKQMYYLLSNADERLMLQTEKNMLDILTNDVELQAELTYDHYIKGE